MHRFLYEYKFSFFWNKCLEVQLLSLTVCMFYIKNNSNKKKKLFILFSRIVVSFYILTINV